MKKDKIKITIELAKGTSHKLEISPASWLLFPDVRTRYNNQKKDAIDIFTKPHLNFECIYRPRKIGRTYMIQWLCFSLHVGVWELTEVGRIYPSGWDYNNQTTAENISRLELLKKTGYFDE